MENLSIKERELRLPYSLRAPTSCPWGIKLQHGREDRDSCSTTPTSIFFTTCVHNMQLEVVFFFLKGIIIIIIIIIDE